MDDTPLIYHQFVAVTCMKYPVTDMYPLNTTLLGCISCVQIDGVKCALCYRLMLGIELIFVCIFLIP
jgi:hypothetical protein